MISNYSTPTTYATAWSGAIFLFIFLFIIALLIVVGIYGSRKSKKEKVQLVEKKRAIESKAKDYHIQLYVVLDLLIENIKVKVANVHNLNISISDVNKWADDVLEKIKDSIELKEMYKSEDRKREFSMIINELSSVKANKWLEEAYFAINLIDNKVDAIYNNSEYKQLVEETKKKYEFISKA